MYDWGFNQEDTSQLISHLIAHNYLNEERFAEAFTSGKVNIKKWGRIKIHQQLKQKRISDYSIKKGLSSIDEVVYMENLQSLALKKWKTLSKERDSYSKKVKVYRFLSSKGYETDLLRNCVDEIAQ